MGMPLPTKLNLSTPLRYEHQLQPEVFISEIMHVCNKELSFSVNRVQVYLPMDLGDQSAFNCVEMDAHPLNSLGNYRHKIMVCYGYA